MIMILILIGSLIIKRILKTSGVDIEQAIEEFVNSLEPSNKKAIIEYTLGLYERCKV